MENQPTIQEPMNDAELEAFAAEQLGLNQNTDEFKEQVRAELNTNMSQPQLDLPPETIEIEAPRSPRKRSGKNQREKAELYNAVNALSEEAEALRLENEQLWAQNQYKDKLSANLVDDNYESKLEQAKYVMKTAAETGDIDTMTEAQSVIAQLHAERTLLRHQKQEMPRAPIKRAANSYAQAPAPEMLNDDYQDFLEDNPWVDERSPLYDPALAAEANLAAEHLRRDLTINNQAHFIGTREFFTAVENIVKSNYSRPASPAPMAAPARPAPSNYRPRNISPVNNMNNPYNSNGHQPTTRSRNPADFLTNEQKLVAELTPLFDSNGMPRSSREKHEHYAKALMAEQQKNQQQGRR